MTVWTDPMMRPFKIGDRVRLVGRYVLNGRSTDTWDRLAQDGAVGEVTNSHSGREETIAVRWDHAPERGARRVDVSCLEREQ